MQKTVTARAVALETSTKPVDRPREARRALELVAMRGKEILGVRHLLDGGTAWLGQANDPLAVMAMDAFGGQPIAVGEVRHGVYALNLPPRARARIHKANGLAKLSIGTDRIVLDDGDRAVLVFGDVQVRAQIVPFETFDENAMTSTAAKAGRWIGLVAAVYVAALGVGAALAPSQPKHLDHGVLDRATSEILTPSNATAFASGIR